MRIITAVLFSVLTILPNLSGQVPSIAPTEPLTPTTERVPAAVPGTAARPLTREDVEAWLDGFIPYALQRGDIAGAVVVVVKDGQVLLPKGYGYADVAARKPVDPERTLFRPGSVSKLFGWTAVMQLVERGKLDLDADVNTYLDFKLPQRGGKAITLRHLLTHTAGFDERARVLIVTDAKYLPSLGQAMKERIPPLVTDPGSTPAYSNYGAALAGYIVERVAGVSFDEFVEREIFAPLGMNRSTFRQPLPPHLEADMSKGYKLGSGDPQHFEIVTVPPAGSLSATGMDMAAFMIAHLQKGAFASGRILEEPTAVQMHTTRSIMIPPLNSMLLGFYENNIRGRRIITHGGDTEFFHSELNLLPDDGVGIYISSNSAGKEGAAQSLRTGLLQEFCARYFPGPLPEGAVDASTAKAHAQLMAGRYTATRRAHSSFLSLMNFLGEMQVAGNADGTITISALRGANGQPKKWTEIAPFVWRDVVGGDRVAAQVENGRVLRFGYDAYPFLLFEPVPWWWSSGWLLPLWLAALAALALTVLAWPVSALVRRRYGVAYGLTGKDAKAHRLVRIAAVAVLAVMIGWAVVIGLIATSINWAGPSMDKWVIVLGILSAAVFVAAAVIALGNAWGVLSSERRVLAKVWSVVLAIACLTALYVAFVFHLPGVSATY